MKAAFLTCAFCLWAGAATAQTTIDLSLADAREVAANALFAGDAGTAADIARAIIAQVPDDRGAWLILAASAPQIGQADEGRRAGARAFALSQNDDERYEAARVTALAAANEERLTLAVYWLRRALIAAPDPDARAQTLADARLLQSRSPWRFDLSATLAPSSNLNGGSAESVASAPGNPTGTLSDDAQALAGWRLGFNLGASYRLRQTETSRSSLGASYELSRVRITDDIDLPDAALATDIVTLHGRHDQALNFGSFGAQISYGQVNYRNLDPATLEVEVQRYGIWRIGLDRRLPLGERAELTLSTGRSLTRYDQTNLGDVRRSTYGASLAYALPGDDILRVTLAYGDSQADNVNYITTDWTLQASYALAGQVGPVTLGFSGGVTWADYPQYRLLLPVDGGRQDETVFYAANIGLPDISYAGFTPVITFSGSSTDSNVSRFTRDSLTAAVTLRSEF